MHTLLGHQLMWFFLLAKPADVARQKIELGFQISMEPIANQPNPQPNHPAAASYHFQLFIITIVQRLEHIIPPLLKWSAQVAQ